MATEQPLKGGTNKLYSVINNFSKGIDRRTADDVALDSTFKELKNFYNAEEGVLSKRPGVYDSHLFDFITMLPTLLRNDVDMNTIGTYWGSNFQGTKNKFNEDIEDVCTRLEDFIDHIIYNGSKEGEEYVEDVEDVLYGGALQIHYKKSYKKSNIVCFKILENNNFMDFLNMYDRVASSTVDFGNYGDSISFKCILGVGGYVTTSQDLIYKDGTKYPNMDTMYSVGNPGIYLVRMAVNIIPEYHFYQVVESTEGSDSTTTYNKEYRTYNINVEFDSVDPTAPCNYNDTRWFLPSDVRTVEGYVLSDHEYMSYPKDTYKKYEETFSKNLIKSLDMVTYNDYTYIVTGNGYFIRVKNNPDTRAMKENYTDESDIFEVIGLGNENIYEPTALELNQIGFNILALRPLEFYKTTGSVSKVKGVFYSRDIVKDNSKSEQPITSVPYNDSFNIHIIFTGSGTPNLTYRENNGETDESLNPYKELKGTWDSTNNKYVCDGLDSERSFEIKITLGDDVFLTYVNTTSSVIDETASIKEIRNLVLKSTHMKIVGNQLVLYGGHGYIFFSEYDEFTYFPNYYYLYVGNTGEETVTSINYFRQYYAIFTNKRIKRMTGTFGADDFGVYPLNDYVGCSNGNTICSVGNNLLFLGNDGIYRLKQGYLGEGTENVEKVDILLGNELDMSNVLECFTLNNNYVIVKNDGKTWYIYNTETGAFYEYDLSGMTRELYNGTTKDSINDNMYQYYNIFESKIYDKEGNFFIVPDYGYAYNDDYSSYEQSHIGINIFRFSDLDFLSEEFRHKDGSGFISELETHDLHLGYPTNNKKFKDIYIKLYNNTEHAVPLYISVWVDEQLVVNPVDYVIKYNQDTDTYYYVSKIQPSKVLGEFTLGKDTLGQKNVEQIKIRVGAKGKAIRLKIADGYDDTSELMIDGVPKKGLAETHRNLYDFSIASIGISYKVKKVKEG